MRWLTALVGLSGGALVAAHLVARLVFGVQEGPIRVLGGVGAALLVLWLVLDQRRIEQATATRSFRRSGLAFLVVATYGALVVVAWLILARHDVRWDLTASRRFTLAPISVEVARGLDRPVTVLGFFQPDTPERTNFRNLVEAYQAHTDRIELRLVDPLMEPGLARQHGIDAYGTVVIQSGDRTARIERDPDEEAFTNALLRLQEGTRHTACFVRGHGERETDDPSPTGLTGVATKLEGQGVVVRDLLLLREGGVPDACEVVAVVDPQDAWLDEEWRLLADWIEAGGPALFLLDPLHADDMAARLAAFGVDVGRDVVIEDNPAYQVLGGDPSWLVVDRDGLDFHPITDPIHGIVLLRFARTVGPAEDTGPWRVQVLARTTDRAWAESDLDPATFSPSFDPDRDRGGPLPLAVAAERTPRGRLVAIGDSDFASNELLLKGNNQDLVLNAIMWLVGDEGRVSVRANEAGRGTFQVTAVQGRLVAFIVLVLAPGAALAAALATWARRRRR